MDIVPNTISGGNFNGNARKQTFNNDSLLEFKILYQPKSMSNGVVQKYFLRSDTSIRKFEEYYYYAFCSGCISDYFMYGKVYENGIVGNKIVTSHSKIFFK